MSDNFFTEFNGSKLKELLKKANGNPVLIAGIITFLYEKFIKCRSINMNIFISLISTYIFRRIKNLSEVALILFYNQDYDSLKISRLLKALKVNFDGTIPKDFFEQSITQIQMNFLKLHRIFIFHMMSGNEFIHPNNYGIIIKLLTEEKVSDLHEEKLDNLQEKTWKILETIYGSNPKIVKDFLTKIVPHLLNTQVNNLIVVKFQALDSKIQCLNFKSYKTCVKNNIPYEFLNIGKYSTLEDCLILNSNNIFQIPDLERPDNLVNQSYLNKELTFKGQVYISLHNFHLGLIDSIRLPDEQFIEFITQVVKNTRSNSKLVEFLNRFGQDIIRVIDCIPMHLRRKLIQIPEYWN